MTEPTLPIKKQLIGTSYNVTDKKLSSMTTTDRKYYTFKEADTNSASLTGNIVSEGRTVTLVYRESEAPTTATVTANYYKEGSQEKLAESVIKADLAIGSEYTTESKTIEGKTTYTLVATPANAYQKTVQQLTTTTVRMLRKQWFPKQQPLLRRRL
ncbi:putative sortase-sorted surface anchored protein (pseudogene) [Streptococcus pneumoniae]|nr:putative sortase-sorted surface anchored protein (pseudogene) [Streptococcus pneumoniae]